MTRFSFLLALGMVFSATAVAEDSPSTGWTGEGAISASTTTGNSETTDVGVAVKGKNDTGNWTTGFEAIFDYGEQDGIEAENRFFLAGQLDRQLNDKLYSFGRVSYEQDEFSGFESRTFVGGGLGYEVIANGQTKWVVEGGPGFKIDEVREILPTPENGLMAAIPSMREESISAIAKSDFSYGFNDNVTFTNVTNALYAQESTQLGNITAITASLTDVLSARIAFEVRHDTNPPLGFEATDTATRFSIVYTLD